MVEIATPQERLAMTMGQLLLHHHWYRELAGEAPRFEKGKGSGAKEDPSPASIVMLIIDYGFLKCQRKKPAFCHK
jgi:hypothetical protein